jgi:hypothetical protein
MSYAIFGENRTKAIVSGAMKEEHTSGQLITEEEDFDEHIFCPSYPNCEEGPLGCAIKMGKNVEWYGHR